MPPRKFPPHKTQPEIKIPRPSKGIPSRSTPAKNLAQCHSDPIAPRPARQGPLTPTPSALGQGKRKVRIIESDESGDEAADLPPGASDSGVGVTAPAVVKFPWDFDTCLRVESSRQARVQGLPAPTAAIIPSTGSSNDTGESTIQRQGQLPPNTGPHTMELYGIHGSELCSKTSHFHQSPPSGIPSTQQDEIDFIPPSSMPGLTPDVRSGSIDKSDESFSDSETTSDLGQAAYPDGYRSPTLDSHKAV
ncbi:hypothetical protein H4Q26_000489 [Puccinia striiformis f. sp. tritici PST-130]|nr:hypothetical protein H4Q26_000489 [Puccinia striiformis f. sp. tritici PST-130]